MGSRFVSVVSTIYGVPQYLKGLGIGVLIAETYGMFYNF